MGTPCFVAWLALTVVDFAKAPLQSLEVKCPISAGIELRPEMFNPVIVVFIRFLKALGRFGNPFGPTHVDDGIARGRNGGSKGSGGGGGLPNGFCRDRVVLFRAIAAS